MSNNVFDTFLNKLIEFPLWVKQIVYMELRNDLSTYLSEDFIYSNKDEIFHLYVPDISYMGQTELESRVSGFDENFYKFLDSISKGLSMIEISMNNFWTMEEVAKYFVLAMEQNYIITPSSKYIMSMACFMSGKYRTAEYFRHVDKINLDQLREAINIQEKRAAEGNPIKMAELMISLGYITEKDCKSLLILKDEAKQRFILDANLIPEVSDAAAPISTEKEEAYKKQILKLQEQNKTLIDQQKKLLLYFKKNMAQNGPQS